jgi:transposase-like protein
MKRCPVCKSANVTLYMGGQFGNYQCKKCSYVGMVIDDESRLDKKSKEILRDMKHAKL